MTDISVIYVNWNTGPLLVKSIATLPAAMPGLDYDVWVVDNTSTDGSVPMVRGLYPDVNVIQNTTNAGFARANNQAMQQAKGRYFLLINTDAFAAPGSIRRMVDLAEHQPYAGIVGARLDNPDGSFQASYVNFPSLWQEFLILSGLGRRLYGYFYPNHAPFRGEPPRAVDYVQGACLLVRRAAYGLVGGMDEGYFMYSEEVDWCYAMRRKGWQVWYQPAARVTHIGSASSAKRPLQREADLYVSSWRYFRKNYGALAGALLQVMLLSMAGVKFTYHTLANKISRQPLGRMSVSPVFLLNRMKRIQR